MHSFAWVNVHGRKVCSNNMRTSHTPYMKRCHGKCDRRVKEGGGVQLENLDQKKETGDPGGSESAIYLPRGLIQEALQFRVWIKARATVELTVKNPILFKNQLRISIQ